MEFVFGLLIILIYCSIKDKQYEQSRKKVGTMEYIFGLLIYIIVLIYCTIKDKQYEKQRKK